MKNKPNESIILQLKLLAIKEKTSSLYYYICQRNDHMEAKLVLREFMKKLIFLIKRHNESDGTASKMEIKSLFSEWSQFVSPILAPTQESFFVEECFEIHGMLRQIAEL